MINVILGPCRYNYSSRKCCCLFNSIHFPLTTFLFFEIYYSPHSLLNPLLALKGTTFSFQFHMIISHKAATEIFMTMQNRINNFFSIFSIHEVIFINLFICIKLYYLHYIPCFCHACYLYN